MSKCGNWKYTIYKIQKPFWGCAVAFSICGTGFWDIETTPKSREVNVLSWSQGLEGGEWTGREIRAGNLFSGGAKGGIHDSIKSVIQSIYTVSESYEELGTTWWGQKSLSLLQRRRHKSRKRRQTNRNWETTWNSVHLVRGDCRSRCRLLRQLDESDAKGETMTCDLRSLFHLISTRRCGCKSRSATTSGRLWHSKGWGRGEKEAFHALPGRAGSLANLAIENMWQILTTHVPCKTWLRSPQSWWSWRNLMRYSWTARDSEGKGQPGRFCDTKRISVCKIALPNQSPPPVCFPCILCLRFIIFPARKYPGACLQCTCTLFIVLFVSLCFLFSSRSLPFRILSER